MDKTINVSLQIIPHIDGSGLYPVVDKVIDCIKESGVNYIVGPMETTMEGDWDTLFAIVKKAHEICFESGAKRVGAVIKTDCKPGGVTIEEKIAKYR
jgi:uncharacterized protein (TIGR00106 family)